MVDMIVAIAFHAGDKHLMIQWAQWVKELGDVKGHEIVVLHPPSVSDSGVAEPLREAFGKCEIYKHYSDIGGWPEGPNEMFDVIARMMYDRKQPFLWCEPDAIPTRARWLDEIDQEFKTQCIPRKLPFMGVLVKPPPDMTKAIDRMNGVGVYSNVPVNCPRALNLGNIKIPFDNAAAGQITNRMYPSSLFQHIKGATFNTKEDLKRIWPTVALFHSCKDGSLIRMLSGKPSQPDVILEPAQPAVPFVIRKRTDPMPPIIPEDTIHTFYEPIPSMRDDRLIELWQSNWEWYGWKTKVWGLKELKDYKPDQVEQILNSANPEGPHKKDHLVAKKYKLLFDLVPAMRIEPDVFNYGMPCNPNAMPLMCEYNRENWDRYPLTHFSLDVVPYPRSQHINKLRPFHTIRPKPKGKLPHGR